MNEHTHSVVKNAPNRTAPKVSLSKDGGNTGKIVDLAMGKHLEACQGKVRSRITTRTTGF